MNIFALLREKLIDAIIHMDTDKGEAGQGPMAAITVEPPRDPSHGDVATNAALVLAKTWNMPPLALAKKMAERFQQIDGVKSATVAGPGFINMTLVPSLWYEVLAAILQEQAGFGNSALGQGKKVNVEYVSANPTGPMHIGHARGAVYGDALALLLLKAGFDVTKEYYINDAGSQINTLLRSAFLRYRQATGEDIGPIPEGYYPGGYLIPVGEGLKEKYGNTLKHMPEHEWMKEIREFTLDSMLALIKNDLLDLGIVHDVFVSEQSLQDKDKINEALELLEKKGLVYKGQLEAPKGKPPEDWEPREQTLFRSTLFGDDVDRPLKKSDGSWTYFAADIAYHLDKIQRGFYAMVVGLGVDHGGYVKRLQAAVSALSDNQAKIEIKLHALVNFLENGVPVKMSKRAGTFATVRDVIDAVGKDIIRFIMLTRKNDMVLDFDVEKVKEQSKDNPVFYVQYAHARAKSVIRHTQKDCPEAVILYNSGNLASLFPLLATEEELALLKIMAAWPRIVEAAAASYEPHRIAFYLQELAAAFHGYWNKGKENAILRFIVVGNPELTAARLGLVKAVAWVIASGLFVFNIGPMEEMR